MITLASASPRRRELLAAVDVAFEVCPANVDETRHPGESAVAYATRVATEKALAVPGRTVLAADTVVVLDDDVVDKPLTPERATAALRRLSGREHRVVTAVVVRRDNTTHAISVVTRVCFRVLSDDEIARYVATGEPLDRAGGYAIQGGGGALVDWIDGSYSNVVGLPVRETLSLLASVGALPAPATPGAGG